MENDFKIEIISPQKTIQSSNCKMVNIPAYEGEMSILKDHISTITFLRPGIIKVYKNENDYEEFFAEDGIVEFSKNNLIILCTLIEKVKKLSKNYLDNLKKSIEEKISAENITDEEKYLLNHKIDTISKIEI